MPILVEYKSYPLLLRQYSTRLRLVEYCSPRVDKFWYSTNGPAISACYLHWFIVTRNCENHLSLVTMVYSRLQTISKVKKIVMYRIFFTLIDIMGLQGPIKKLSNKMTKLLFLEKPKQTGKLCNKGVSRFRQFDSRIFVYLFCLLFYFTFIFWMLTS